MFVFGEKYQDNIDIIKNKQKTIEYLKIKYNLKKINTLDESKYPMYYDGTSYYKDSKNRITLSGIYLASGYGTNYDKLLLKF